MPEGNEDHGGIALPQRLPLAALISLSTSRQVKCSLGRSSAFGRLVGVTVRLTVAGDTSLSVDLAIEIAPE